MIKLYFLFLVLELSLGIQKVNLPNNMENMENHPNSLALGQVAKCFVTSCFWTRLSLNASSYTRFCMAVEQVVGKVKTT